MPDSGSLSSRSVQRFFEFKAHDLSLRNLDSSVTVSGWVPFVKITSTPPTTTSENLYSEFVLGNRIFCYNVFLPLMWIGDAFMQD